MHLGNPEQRTAQPTGGRLRASTVACFAVVALSASAAEADPETPVFLPAFHQGLRWSLNHGVRVTYRMKFPLGRGGNRVRVAFKSGDEPLEVFVANIAFAGTRGALASDPVQLTFNGSRGFAVSPHQRIVSDPVSFVSSFGAEVYVSYEANGSLGGSTINAFPDSYVWPGNYAADRNPPPGEEFPRAIGIDTVDVEGAPGRAIVALGDSITEGYVSGDVGLYRGHADNYRNAWPAVAQDILHIPVANAAVSAQGLNDAIQALPTEVFTLRGITDCAILIGTNDLGAMTAEQIESRMSDLLDQLRPFCRLWLGTLLPKENIPGTVDYPTIVARRAAVNDWIRRRARVSAVIDFEASLAMPGDVNRFRPGLGEDGIHPSIAGQRVMGEEAARILLPPRALNVSPTSAAATGGTPVTVEGENFKPGASVLLSGSPISDVVVSAPTSLRFTAPPHAAGTVDISVANPDGLSSTLSAAFTYTAAPGDPPPVTTPPGSTPEMQKKTGCNASGSTGDIRLLLCALALFAFGSRSPGRRRPTAAR